MQVLRAVTDEGFDFGPWAEIFDRWRLAPRATGTWKKTQSTFPHPPFGRPACLLRRGDKAK